MVFVGRSAEVRTIGQHNDGLKASLAFGHRKPDRLGAIREQPAHRCKSRGSVERETDEQFSRKAETERNHQQEPETSHHLQRRRWVDFARIIRVEPARRRIVVFVGRHAVP